MLIMGILVTLLGFCISFVSLGVTSANGARLAMVLTGIAVSLFGIIGVLNRHFLRNAIWRR